MNCPSCNKPMDRIKPDNQPWIDCWYCWDCKVRVGPEPGEKFCHFCNKDIEHLRWQSQPITTCPDCGNVLNVEVDK